jgi:hypothetical protein
LTFVNLSRLPDGKQEAKTRVCFGEEDMWNNLKRCLLILTVAGVMVLSSGCTVDISGEWPEDIVIDIWGNGDGHDHGDYEDDD